MNQLNEKIWNGKKLIPEIKEKLLTISRKIVNDLSIDVKLKNVLFTGSLASFVWRASSDIDLHLIVKTEEDYGEVIDDYLDMYSKIFNNYHSIFIKGYKLELNIKREEKFLDDKGIYDILTDKWLQIPSKPNPKIYQDEEIKDMVLNYQDRIDSLINNDAELEEIDNLRKDIKTMRSNGLSEDGEYSTGNLVFKELRHSGYLEKLYDFKQKKEDDFLSFESFGKYFNRESHQPIL